MNVYHSKQKTLQKIILLKKQKRGKSKKDFMITKLKFYKKIVLNQGIYQL